MLSGDVQEIVQPARHLVGFSIKASLSEIIAKKLGNKLREQLAARGGEIPGRAGDGVYLVQIYDPAPYTPDTPFTQIMALEVTRPGDVPEGMVAHTIPAGSYLRFTHLGPMNGIGKTYEAMHKWLAEQRRGGPCPFDFEYWQDVSRLEEADTVITLHLPIGKNGKVGSP